MIFKIAVFVLVCVMLAIILRQHKPEYSFALSAVCAIVVFYMLYPDIQTVVEMLKGLSKRSGIEEWQMTLILKSAGITYLTGFTSSVCYDTGEHAMAEKVEFAGKLSILVLATPIVFSLVDMITGILP